MKRYLITTDNTNPHENLALESAILDACGEDEEYLYLWQNRHTVVIGRNQNAWRECYCDLLKNENGFLARRSSGGGAVYHDLGNLNFTFIASKERYSLENNLALIKDTLNRMGINAEFTGRNDMTVNGAKFSGSAFKHTKTASLHHGTLLISADMDLVSRYLRPDESKLKAKGVASIRARVCNLNEFLPTLTPAIMKEALKSEYSKRGDIYVLRPDDLDFADYAEKYSTWEWNYGETPQFDISLETRFPFGGVQLFMTQKHGLIEKIAVYTDSMDETLSEKLIALLQNKPYTPETLEQLKDYPEIAAWLKTELPF